MQFRLNAFVYLGFHSQTYNRINDSETFYEKSFN